MQAVSEGQYVQKFHSIVRNHCAGCGRSGSRIQMSSALAAIIIYGSLRNCMILMYSGPLPFDILDFNMEVTTKIWEILKTDKKRN